MAQNCFSNGVTSYHYLEFLASWEWQERGGGNFVDRFLKFTICTHLVSKRARKLLDFKLIFFWKNSTFLYFIDVKLFYFMYFGELIKYLSYSLQFYRTPPTQKKNPSAPIRTTQPCSQCYIVWLMIGKNPVILGHN